MKCTNHAEVDAAGYCRQCGKGLCPECTRDVRGVIYCENCLAQVVTAGSAAATPDAPNPGVALALGFIPGVGAIYNGEYLKGLIHIIIFGSLISWIDSPPMRGMEPLFGMLMAAFYVYMPIDAYRTAKRRAGGLAPTAGGWEGIGLGGESGAPIGPLVLIVVGAIFLLQTLGLFEWGWLHLGRFWPVILIALGAYMLWKRTAGGRPSGGSQGGGQ